MRAMFEFLIGGIVQKIGLAMASALVAFTGFGGATAPDDAFIPGGDEVPFEEVAAAALAGEPIEEPEPEPEPAPVPKKAVSVPAVPPPPADACLNIGDVQKTVPAGLLAVNGICLPEEDVDRCPNIEGIQSAVPQGLIFHKGERACLTEGQIERIEEEQEVAVVKKPAATKKTTVQQEEKPSAAPASAEEFVDKDCADFATHAEAQAFYEAEGGPENDPHKLDGNNKNGLACESLP